MTANPGTAANSVYARSLDCVHCGLCLEACPTYKVLGLETDSPRGRIYLMRALAEGKVEDQDAIRPHLDRCIDCRACESVCPSGVQYGTMLETARAEMEAASPARGFTARVRRFLLWHLVAHQRRLRWAFRLAWLGERLGLRRLAVWLRLLPRWQDALLPRIPGGGERAPLVGTFAPAAASRGTVLLFTGCVMEQMFGRINRTTRDVLVANGFTVRVPTAQGCCGALLVHNGQKARARQLAARNVAAFAGEETIVVNSAGCGCALREYGHLLETADGEAFAARVRDVSEVLAEAGLTATPAAFDGRVAYDDPCHLCHGQGVRAQPRALLRQVPDLELVPHTEPEECCGSGGIYNLAQRHLAAEIGRRKAGHLIASGADCVATGNPGCMLQIRAHLRAAGSEMRVVHPIELLAPARGRESRDHGAAEE